MPVPTPTPSIKPMHVLIICLCVAAALFAGSIAIGWAAWQSNKDSGSPVQSDQP
jgi:hypothetical protein